MSLQDIPEELKQFDNWTGWKGENRKPLNLETGGNAQSDNPATWASFTMAQEKLCGWECFFDGVGVVVPKGFVGFDFDGVVVDGKVEPFVLDILKVLQNPYCEISPSGNGLRAFVKFDGPALPKQMVAKDKTKSKYGVEVFAGSHTNKVLTVTGDQLCGKGVPTLETLDHAYFLCSQLTNSKFKKLWVGDISDYDNDQSSADLALMGMLARLTNNNAQLMEFYFESSALGQRDKWTTRSDYRESTIRKAMSNRQQPPISDRSLILEESRSTLSPTNNFERIAGAVAKHENFNLLISKEALAVEAESWLSQHAQKPSQLRNTPIEWLVDRVAMRTGLHIFAAKQGSFKSIMALFLALALVTGLPYLGRATQTQFGADMRPLRVYYIDRENPESYARACCLRIDLETSESQNGNMFRLLGEWLDESPILYFDDPRLIEAAKRERSFFIFDSLSQFVGSASENDNSEMTVELNKAKSLARISEGVLILHHDDKSESGWRGCTAIMAVPDMCFNLSRGDDNQVTFSELRFRPTGPYVITAQVSFGAEGEDFNRRYSYRVVESTLDADLRSTRMTGRNAKDAELIAAARQAIEENAVANKKPLSQRKLATLVGIVSASVRDRVLCQNTKTTPRPWDIRPNGTSLGYYPLTPGNDVETDGEVGGPGATTDL